MIDRIDATRILLIISLLGALVLSACQGGQITIDMPSGDGGDGSALSNQTFFILLIVLLVAMVAMVFVAMSSR